MNKKRFLKSILATSALAAALVPNAALGAATRTTVAADVDTTTAAGVNLDAAVVAGNGDDVQLGHNIKSLTVTAAVTSPTAIDLKGFTITNGITANDGTNIGSIYDSAAAKTSTLTVAAGATATLTGTDGGKLAAGKANTYTGLGATTIGDGSTLKINQTAAADLTFAKTFDGSAAGKGTLQLSKAGQTVTFNGIVGGTKGLAAITIDAEAKARFTKNVTATTTTVASHADSLLTIGAAGANDTATTHTGDITVTDAGTVATANKANIKGNLTLTTANGKFTVADASTVTLTGNIAGHANAKSTIGDGATLTFDGAAARTVASDISGSVANKGKLVFGGKADVTTLGANNALAEIQTADGTAADKRLKATGAITTKKLTLGTAGLETAENVTIGADGSNGTGALTFTAAKTLDFDGDYAATGDISTNSNLVITANGDAKRTISAAIKPSVANKTLTFTAAGGGANSKVVVEKNIGGSDAANIFDNVTLTGANDRLYLGKDITVHSKVLTLTDAGSTVIFAGDNAKVKGAITPAAGGGKGVIRLEGSNVEAGSVDMTLDTTNTLAAFTVDAAAQNSTLTIGVVNGGVTTHKINALNFLNTKADDTSGLIIDLKPNTAAHAYTLETAAASTIAKGSHGMIRFVNNTHSSAVTLKNRAGNFGAADKKLHLLDNSGHALTIDADDTEVHVSTIKASEVTLNKAKLGVYTLLDADKLTVTTNNSSILTKSKLKDATELHFATDHQLTLGEAVKFNGKITAATDNEGTLVLGKNGELATTAAGASDKTIKAVNITTGGAANVATVKSIGSTRASHYVNAYNFTAAGTLNFEGNLYGSVTTGANGAGTLVLQGGDITKSVGAAAAQLLKVTLDTTENVTIGSDTAGGFELATNALHFAKDGTLTLDAKLTTAVTNTGAITTALPNTGSLVLNQDFTPEDHVGEVGKALKSVKISGSNTLTVLDTKNYYVTNTDSGTGDNILAFGGTTTATGSNFGANGRFNNTTTVANKTVTLNNLYTKNLANAGTLNVKTLDLTEAATGAGTINILDGGSATQATGAKLTAGNVVAKGSATIGGNIDGTLTLEGANVAKVVNFKGDTVTGQVTADNSTLILNQNTEMTGGYAGTSATLDLNGNKLTVKGTDVVFNGAETTLIVRPGSQIISDEIKITEAAGKLNLKVRGGLRGNLPLFTKLDGSAVTITANGADATANNFALEASSNPFYKDVTISKGVATVSAQTDINKAATQGILANANSSSLVKQVMNYVGSTGSDDAIMGKFMDSYADSTEATRTEMVGRLAEQYIPVADVANDALGQAAHAAHSRMVPVFASADAGVAAGDAADKYGAYVKGTFGTATQKMRKSTSGYKSNTYGAFVGVDAAISDSVSIGVLAGYNNGTLKHKDTKAGDKSKSGSLTFGAYGSYDFGNNYFAQANAAVAQTTVKNNSKRVLGNNSTAVAHAKYDVMAYAAEIRGGYNFRFDNSALVPTAGLRFNYLGDTSYTETGAGLQNVKHSGKARNSLDAVAGVMLSTTLDMDGMVMQPELHMNVDYRLSNSAPKADYNLDTSGIKFQYTGAKPAKFGYNFGASLMAQNDNMEYGAGYDARISDKYLGHQGSVKVKLNF